METETATNPVDGGDTSQETAGATQEVETQIEQQYDDEGNLIEIVEEEEIELDDLKLKLPKDQAEKARQHLLRQADYTRKTQELAEQRKAFEAQTQQIQQASQAERQTEAAILAMDAQLAQYANVNWAAEMQAADAIFDDARKAQLQAAFMQYTQLRDARGNAVAQYQNYRGQREYQQQQEAAKLADEGRAAVAKIPGWSEKTQAELTDFAIKELGADADEARNLIPTTPNMVRALMYAKKGFEAERNAARAQSHVQAQQAQPAAKVSGNAVPPGKLDDRMSTEAWVKLRNKQVRQGA